jgi:hypothetical protein
VKAGHSRAGSQRYLCRACSRTYTPESKPLGYTEAKRREALQYYARYLSVRWTARLFSISPQTLVNWVDAAHALAQAAGTGGVDELTERVSARRSGELMNREFRRDMEQWKSKFNKSRRRK